MKTTIFQPVVNHCIKGLKNGVQDGKSVTMLSSKFLSAILLVLIMAIAPLSGCIGNNDDVETPDFNDIFTLNQVRADLAVVVAGEYNEFILEGEGTMITVPEDIMLFVNNTIIPSGMAVVKEDRLFGMLLPTPYVTNATLNITHANGVKDSYPLPVANGTAIVNGDEWFDKMEFITQVCADSTRCGGYINRWMGRPNPAFERAASFFQGHFEGLGYDTHILSVLDHQNPTEPESLNVIAWKYG